MKRIVSIVGVLVLLATLSAQAQAPTKVKVGVLKLTSSAVVFLGVEKGYFKEFGVEPELVYFQAAQPIAVALASGDIEVGATGLTAGLFNIVAGGVRIWIVADKGREWPDHNLTALLVRKDLYAAGARTMRDLKGKRIGITQVGSTFHYNIGRYLEKEGWRRATSSWCRCRRCPRSTTRSWPGAWTPSPPPSPSSRAWRRRGPA